MGGRPAPPPNLFREDPNLRFVLARHLPAAELDRAERVLDELGSVAGGELDELAAVAERHPPVLRQWDRRGERVDEVVYHPAYRRIEDLAFERFGLAAASHRAGLHGFDRPLPHVLKYAMTYVFAQAEFGVLCPVNMTDSLIRVLRRFASPELRAELLPRLTALPRDRRWQGAMFMTERTGGSDAGAIATSARRADAGRWLLTGEKWFCSNVDAEAALVLARPEGAAAGTRGLGLFLVPRDLPDGRRNGRRVNRLKDKFGSRDMATGEVTLDGALGYLVGELGRGFVQMTVMINASRLSNAVRSVGMMRRGFFEALCHARTAHAFGVRLIDLPLQRRVLMEMLVDLEGAVAAIAETAAMLERADAGDGDAGALVRILTPLLKATVTRRARATAGEAMEALGGSGYVEEWVTPRLVRDAHLGSIWEGTTNVVQLDVLRAMVRQGCHRALLAWLAERLARLDAPPLAGLRALLGEAHRRIAARCEEVLAMPRPAQEIAMRRLAPALLDLVAAVCLAEEAAHQLAAEGGARKLVVAAAHAGRRLGRGDEALDDPELAALIEPIACWARLVPDDVAGLVGELVR